jgi:cysteine synthase A
MIHEHILSTIGQTPLVYLDRLTGPNSGRVIGKMESHNPSGSVKDRIAWNMVEEAEKNGTLKPGMTIVEPTSGNTGIGLAMVAAVKGYKAVFVMPETMSVERRSLLLHFGAEIILTPGPDGMRGAMQEAAKLAADSAYFMPRQFHNQANPEAHKKHTAKEIIEALGDVKPDYFVAGVGTGGTISGAGERLKAHYPALKLVAVEPVDSPVLSGGQPGPHKIQGIGAGFKPDVLNMEIVDDIMRVTFDDAVDTAKALCRKEGILAGISAGGNVWAALQVAAQAGPDSIVVTIVCDTGERYLSTDLFK